MQKSVAARRWRRRRNLRRRWQRLDRGDSGNNLLPVGQTAGNDTVDGGAGDDTVLGGDGDDQISGGDGTDVLVGEGGNDLMYGQAGIDYLDGRQGNDQLSAAMAMTSCSAMGSPPRMASAATRCMERTVTTSSWVNPATTTRRARSDVMYGDDGNDLIYGGAGDDYIYRWQRC